MFLNEFWQKWTRVNACFFNNHFDIFAYIRATWVSWRKPLLPLCLLELNRLLETVYLYPWGILQVSRSSSRVNWAVHVNRDFPFHAVMWSRGLRWVNKNSKWLRKDVPQTTSYGRNSFSCRNFHIQGKITTQKTTVIWKWATIQIESIEIITNLKLEKQSCENAIL